MLMRRNEAERKQQKLKNIKLSDECSASNIDPVGYWKHLF